MGQQTQKSLRGSTVLVTGANRGIGAALVNALGDGGHEVAFSIAWLVYAALVAQRFGIRAPARQCALGLVCGFLLLLGLAGSEWLA